MENIKTNITHSGARDVTMEGGAKQQFFLSSIEVVFGCCGLEVHQGCRSKQQNDSMAEARLKQWLEGRAKRHRCALVSKDNPLGLLPPRAPLEA